MASRNVIISNEQGVTTATIRVSSLTDGPDIEDIGKTLVELVDERDCRKLIVDFRAVNFLSSSMIGVLVQLEKKSKANDGQIVLCGLRDSLMKVFKITRLDKMLTFAKDEQEAMSKFKQW
jgi:anti-sigma B factor antagonist